jgi:aminoglycoside phosphotransferase (APT) family kinase protein
VFRDGQPYAFIDFDAAALGSRAYDLGYAAWLWLDVGGESYPSCEQTRRLRLFLSAYGSELADAAIVQAMLDRQAIVIAEAARIGKAGMADWAKNSMRWILRHWLPISEA